MAAEDIVTEAVQVDFSNELLSPAELFNARSRSHKIPVKGQKEFLPTGSDQQRTRLQKSLEEHWTLVSEERVERLGNLVTAKWIPEEKLVKLQSPAGKFWQTMGFSNQGKQYLLPEEALYLMECGSVQVFYQDLPLSIQEAYERFLSPETVTPHQYQVFGHLKRLGYVVNRFDYSTVSSMYERQLNLPPDRLSKQLKRKRSNSLGSRQREKQNTMSTEETATKGQHTEDVMTGVPCLDETVSVQQRTEQNPQIEPMESSRDLNRATGRNWWTDASSQSQFTSGQPAAPLWDFSCISFPDLGLSQPRGTCLAAPDPTLLPGALQVSKCEVAPWLRKLNLKEGRLSLRQREMQRERDRYHRDVNNDQEVQRCRNWAEYLQLIENRRKRLRGERPASLWQQDVTPLTQPGQCASHRDLLQQVSILQSSHLLEEACRLPHTKQWRICFNVYQPDAVADFKKSHPGKPYTRMCVCSFDGPVPDLQVMKQLSFQSGDVPVTFAVVDHGDLSFYCFKEFKLPTDIY